MRLATWNINSIRARHERVVTWLVEHDVDVLALQETKCKDAQFPREPFEHAGYEIVTHGLNQWNGVAIASRVGIHDPQIGFENMPQWGDPPVVEARALGATCGGIRVWSLYVPNGREIDHPHMEYKLSWLAALREAGKSWLASDPHAKIALVGDWNVAPQDDDVWDMAAFEGLTHVTPAERQAFSSVIDAGFVDAVRPFAPGPGVYTYWDYQQLRFPRKEGMRIDFALTSPALTHAVGHGWIDREARKGKSPSDHAPVVIDIQDLD